MHCVQWNLQKKLLYAEVKDIRNIMSKKTLDIKLIKSSIGRLPNHKKCVKGLGFRKLQQTVTVEDTPSNRGMINKIRDMLEVKES